MGYILHHAIVVVGWDDEKIAKAHETARRIMGDLVSDVIPSRINGYRSFYIAPDGSKEGWDESETGDEQRARYIKWLADNPKLYLDWMELQFGGDSHTATIRQHSREILDEA